MFIKLYVYYIHLHKICDTHVRSKSTFVFIIYSSGYKLRLYSVALFMISTFNIIKSHNLNIIQCTLFNTIFNTIVEVKNIDQIIISSGFSL